VQASYRRLGHAVLPPAGVQVVDADRAELAKLHIAHPGDEVLVDDTQGPVGLSR